MKRSFNPTVIASSSELSQEQHSAMLQSKLHHQRLITWNCPFICAQFMHNSWSMLHKQYQPHLVFVTFWFRIAQHCHISQHHPVSLNGILHRLLQTLCANPCWVMLCNCCGCTLRKKSTSEHLFWCFRLSQIEDSIEYLKGPNSTWKDHDRNLGVQMDKDIPIMVLPGTIWSFQVLDRVLYLWQPEAPKRCFEVLFFLECMWTHTSIGK